MENQSSVIKFLKVVFIGIPNLPFLVALVFYLYYKMIKETGMVEMEFVSDDELLHRLVETGKMYIDKTASRVVAIIAWTSAILFYIR